MFFPVIDTVRPGPFENRCLQYIVIVSVWDNVGNFFSNLWRDILQSIPNPIKKFLGIKSVQVNVDGARKENTEQKSETDVRVKVDMPNNLTGTIVSKKQKGAGSKVTVKLNNAFAGPTLAGVQ